MGVTKVVESAVIDAPYGDVWAVVRGGGFAFLPGVSAAANANVAVGDNFTLKYKDGTAQTLKCLEISELTRTITWEVIASEPAISYMSAIHTIALSKVTENNQTFIQFTSDFSSDAKSDVTEDSRYKKREAFQQLRKLIKKK